MYKTFIFTNNTAFSPQKHFAADFSQPIKYRWSYGPAVHYFESPIILLTSTTEPRLHLVHQSRTTIAVDVVDRLFFAAWISRRDTS